MIIERNFNGRRAKLDNLTKNATLTSILSRENWSGWPQPLPSANTAALAMQIKLFLILKLLFNHQFSLKPKLSQHDNWHMLCLLCGLTPAKWWAKLTPSAGGGTYFGYKARYIILHTAHWLHFHKLLSLSNWNTETKAVLWSWWFWGSGLSLNNSF